MAWEGVENLTLGELLQIAFVNGVRNQVSQEHREFDMITSKKVSSEAPREIRFSLQEGLLPNNVSMLSSTASNFPTPFDLEINEYTAKMKTIAATIDESTELWRKANETPLVYAKPLLLKADAISRSIRRQISADVHGDGTGVIGTISSVDDTNVAAGSVVVTLDSSNDARGFVGWFEFGGLYKAYANTGGSALAPSGGTGADFAYWKCIQKDRTPGAHKVTMQLVKEDGQTLATGYAAETIAATNVFYRASETIIPDLTGISTTDYSTLSGTFAGLETLASDDGRKIHGMTMSGVLAASRYDVGGSSVIDTSHLLAALDQGKIKVGGGMYKYKTMLTSPEAAAVFIDGKESDRRFNAVADNGRGSPGFAYTHYEDTLVMETTEFVRQNRIWMSPEDSSGNRVLECHMADVQPVNVGGVDLYLNPSSSGGHTRRMNQYFEGYLTLVSRHPAAIIAVENFNLS